MFKKPDAYKNINSNQTIKNIKNKEESVLINFFNSIVHIFV
jgi:hypothetical protein